MSGDLVVLGSTDPARAAELVKRLSDTTELTTDHAGVRFRTQDGAAALPVLLRELDAAGVAMTSVEVRRPSLDDVFLTLTGRSLRDAEQTPEPAEAVR